jgi:hypothetical protein
MNLTDKYMKEIIEAGYEAGKKNAINKYKKYGFVKPFRFCKCPEKYSKYDFIYRDSYFEGYCEVFYEYS